MQPDRGMMWPAENPELAREFPAGTASKARQSRLHQAQGSFPVFVFHSFVQFLNIQKSPVLLVQWSRDEFATYSTLLQLIRCGFALDEFTDKMQFLLGKGFVYRLAMDATRQGGLSEGCHSLQGDKQK